MAKLRYNTVKDFIESKGCVLLTTENEFKEQKLHSKSKYRILSKCKHENIIQYDNFKQKNCGVMCKSCVSHLSKSELSTLDVEYTGFCVLRDKLKNELVVKKMVEGTRADFAVKPRDCLEDLWLPIQLKVTQHPTKLHSNNYCFNKVNKYSGMIVLCFCISDKRSWIIFGDLLINLEVLHIGNKKSKYSQYEVKFNELPNILKISYGSSHYKLQNLEYIDIPVSEQQRCEQEYRRIREQSFRNILFEYPERDGLCYDFKVNNFRVQEKIASNQRKNKTIKNNRYLVFLSGHKPYKKHDNHFYWINLPDKEHFYILPEAALIDGGFISNDEGPPLHKTLPCYPLTSHMDECKHIWINKYLFRYSSVEQTIIENIFTTGLVPEQKIIKIKQEKPENYIEMCRERMAKAKGKAVILMQNDVPKHEFASINEAARYLNVHHSTVSRAVRENRECNGYYPILQKIG